jgi:hypothetical protein
VLWLFCAERERTFNLITITSQTSSTLSAPSLSHALKLKDITQTLSLLQISPANSRGSSTLSLLHLSPHKVKDLLTVIKHVVLVLLLCYMLPLSLNVNKAC